jgi:hypothetical protein
MRNPNRRGRSRGYPERGPDRGRRRRPGEGLPALLGYLHDQLRRHRGPRELAYSVIAADLRMSPTAAFRWSAWLCRAGALRRHNRDTWQLVDRQGRPSPVAPIAPWHYRPAELRPHRPITLWYPGERLLEARGQARRGPIALFSWLQAVRDQWSRLLDSLRECKDRLRAFSTPPGSGAKEPPAGGKRSEWPPGGQPRTAAPPPVWVIEAMRDLFSKGVVAAGYTAAPAEAGEATPRNIDDAGEAALGARATLPEDGA